MCLVTTRLGLSLVNTRILFASSETPRIIVQINSGYCSGASKTAWFTYDANSRVAVVNGQLSGGNIVLAQDATSYWLAYDGDGNAVTRTFLSDGSQVSASGTAAAVGDVMAQTSVYDANGNLIRTNYALDLTEGDSNNGVQETRSYDANGVPSAVRMGAIDGLWVKFFCVATGGA